MSLLLSSGICHDVLARQWGPYGDAYRGAPLLWKDLPAALAILSPQCVPWSLEQGPLVLTCMRLASGLTMR